MDFSTASTPRSAEFAAGAGCEILIVLRRLQISDYNDLLGQLLSFIIIILAYILDSRNNFESRFVQYFLILAISE